jgi:hypothetical protein
LCRSSRMTGHLFSSSLGLNRRGCENPGERQAVWSDDVNPLCTSRGHPFLLTLSITQLSGWHPKLEGRAKGYYKGSALQMQYCMKLLSGLLETTQSCRQSLISDMLLNVLWSKCFIAKTFLRLHGQQDPVGKFRSQRSVVEHQAGRMMDGKLPPAGSSA